MAKKKEKKEKKAGKRMSKKELAALLIDFFHAKPSETLSMKYIFSELHLTTIRRKCYALICYTNLQMTIIFPKLKKESSASTITERR